MKEKASHTTTHQSSHTHSEPSPNHEGISIASPDALSFAKEHGGIIQPKLTIGAPHDKYEREADAMANQVMKKISDNSERGARIQRKCASCERKEKIQRKEAISNSISPISSSTNGVEASPDLVTNLQKAKGKGKPLPEKAKSEMEAAFGYDFSKVRIHTDRRASEMNNSIQSKAFTHGVDIYFNQNEYNLNSALGKKLAYHEATHVIQQRGRENDNIQRAKNDEVENVRQETSEKTEGYYVFDISKKVKYRLLLSSGIIQDFHEDAYKVILGIEDLSPILKDGAVNPITGKKFFKTVGDFDLKELEKKKSFGRYMIPKKTYEKYRSAKALIPLSQVELSEDGDIVKEELYSYSVALKEEVKNLTPKQKLIFKVNKSKRGKRGNIKPTRENLQLIREIKRKIDMLDAPAIEAFMEREQEKLGTGGPVYTQDSRKGLLDLDMELGFALDDVHKRRIRKEKDKVNSQMYSEKIDKIDKGLINHYVEAKSLLTGVKSGHYVHLNALGYKGKDKEKIDNDIETFQAVFGERAYRESIDLLAYSKIRILKALQEHKIEGRVLSDLDIIHFNQQLKAINKAQEALKVNRNVVFKLDLLLQYTRMKMGLSANSSQWKIILAKQESVIVDEFLIEAAKIISVIILSIINPAIGMLVGSGIAMMDVVNEVEINEKDSMYYHSGLSSEKPDIGNLVISGADVIAGGAGDLAKGISAVGDVSKLTNRTAKIAGTNRFRRLDTPNQVPTPSVRRRGQGRPSGHKIAQQDVHADGSKLKIFDDGSINICNSPCLKIRELYAKALNLKKNEKLLKELDRIEIKLKNNPNSKSAKRQLRRWRRKINQKLPDIREQFKPINDEEGDRIFRGMKGKLGVPGEVMTHRSKYSQSKVSKGTGDDAGHFIGNQFGAPGTKVNLSRQNREANQTGTWKRLETLWAQKLRDGSEIEVEVVDVYRKGEPRPYRRDVKWTETKPDGTVTTHNNEAQVIYGNFPSKSR